MHVKAISVSKQTIAQAGELFGRRVFIRSDLNVPIQHGRMVDDTRIRAALPTIDYLRGQGARTIVCTHLDRARGSAPPARLHIVREALSTLLGGAVKHVEDCIGPAVSAAVDQLVPGEVLLLENVDFYAEEQLDDSDFAARLSNGADLFVNDAFACAHQALASTEAIGRILPAYAGLLMQRELVRLSQLSHHLEKPFSLIIGGAHLADKLALLQELLPLVDTLLVGGVPATTLLKAKGMPTGISTVDRAALTDASRFLEIAGSKLVLPIDLMIANDIDAHAGAEVCPSGVVPLAASIVDIGPDTRALFKERLNSATTIVWLAPLGINEIRRFAQGTLDIITKVASMKTTVITGGADLAGLIERTGKTDALTHVSTAGIALLRFLLGETLPAISVLRDT